MKKRIGILLFIVVLVASAAFIVGAQDAKKEPTSEDLFKQIQILSDSITLVMGDYVEPVEPKDLIHGAIKGLMNTLDGYSQFLDEDSFREITEETKGQFGGIGIEIGMRDKLLTVIAPMEDTPAFEAGLKSGDKVVKIDDKVTRDMTLDEAVKMLRGQPGEKVEISVVREDVDEVLDFTITRAIIKLKSIKEVKIVDEGVGYVKIGEFQERTAQDLRDTIKGLQKVGAKSIIIDIRNNPGGLLESAVDVSEHFLQPGEMIVYTEGRDPKKRMEFKAKKKALFPEITLVILVNKGSASAAEILAGAIKDNNRGVIIGTTTFGKGSVQTVIPLRDKSALRLTTAAYYTPAGNDIREKGIDPDIVVERINPTKEKNDDKEVQKAKVFDKIEDKKDEKPEDKKEEKYDNQLQAAIDILKSHKIFDKTKETEKE